MTGIVPQTHPDIVGADRAGALLDAFAREARLDRHRPFLAWVVEEILEYAPSAREIWFHGEQFNGSPLDRDAFEILVVMPPKACSRELFHLNRGAMSRDAIPARIPVEFPSLPVEIAAGYRHRSLPDSIEDHVFSRGLLLWNDGIDRG